MDFKETILSKCIELIQENIHLLEEELQVSAKWEVLPEVRKEHLYLGKKELLMGIFSSSEELITIYPMNIWMKMCGLVPEPHCWDVFEEKVIEVFAHEIRHMWQHKNGTYYQDNAEWDAMDYSMDFIQRKVS